MADKLEKQIKDIQTQKFYLTDKTRETGYSNTNYDLVIDFERDYQGNRLSRFASIGHFENGEFVSDKLDYLTGLTEEQVYVLAVAKVIKIKKDQHHYFQTYLKKIPRTTEDE